MKNLGIACCAVLLALSIGCKDEPQTEIDDMLIREYIEENMLEAESTESGLYIVIEEPGNDQHPDITNRVSIRYAGSLLNGNQFDSSNGNVVSFNLWELIAGWQEGIPYFGKGGSGQLLVPSHLGYGSRQVGSIPPNSVLVFDIELVDFN